MVRSRRAGLWFLLVAGLSGCADNMPNILRDWYNVEHEFFDNMIIVVDENSAKRYNTVIRDRVRPKEDIIKERKEKFENGVYTQKDKEELKQLVLTLESTKLAPQLNSLEARYRQMQQRTRKLLVKLALDKAEEMKRSTDREFTIKAADEWKELSALELPGQFTKAEIGGGGLMNPMMPGMPGGGQPQEKKEEKKRVVDPDANKNLQLHVICRPRGGNQWEPPIVVWKSGGKEVRSPLIVPPSDIDITPLTP